MNKRIKNLVSLSIIIFTTLIINTAMAIEPAGNAFSYQGELLDNGSPANGQYDILFISYDEEVDGNPGPIMPSFTNVEVTNGLFHIEQVDFGDFTFTGDAVWLELYVKKSSNPDEYSMLSPRQRIGTAPYASQSQYAIEAINAQNADQADTAVEAQSLAAGSANLGDVLRFDGADWISVSLESINQSPWTINNNDISYTTGDVGIGTINPATEFHIDSNGGFELSRFDGGSRMFNSYYENGSLRGYIGSFQDGTNSGTNTADFEVGTTSNNSTGKMHLVTQANPRLTIDDKGLVGINQTIPLARLHIDAESNESVFRARLGGSTKFWIKSTGNTHVIEDLIAQSDTTVQGDFKVNGDSKQDADNNGMLKYMVVLDCAGENSSINRQYNGTNTAGNVTIDTINNAGFCKLEFPTDISDRFVVASSDTGVVNAGCDTGLSNTITCSTVNVSLGTLTNSVITVMVY